MKDIQYLSENTINKLKSKVSLGETSKLSWRIEQIEKINFLLDNYKIDIINSLHLDLGKSKVEALSEILLIKEEILLIKRILSFGWDLKM